MTKDARHGATGHGDDPELRWFRGAKATDAASLAASDQPPREVRMIIQQLWASAIGVLVAGGVPWLLAATTDRFPVVVAWIMTPVVLVIGAACAVIAIQLRRGSERTRAFLAGPGEESPFDVFVLGGYWMFTRERLRTRSARAWFHHRTRLRRERRTGGPQ